MGYEIPSSNWTFSLIVGLSDLVLRRFFSWELFHKYLYWQDLGHDLRFREHFDVAVARAVAEMRVLGDCCDTDLYSTQ